MVPQRFAAATAGWWRGQVFTSTHGLVTPIEESYVKLRWRVDRVDVPWLS